MIELRVPSYKDAWDEVGDLPGDVRMAHQHLAHQNVERGVGEALVRMGWSGVQPSDALRRILVTTYRMCLWSMDPEAGARLEWRLSDPGPGVRGDQ